MSRFMKCGDLRERLVNHIFFVVVVVVVVVVGGGGGCNYQRK